MWLCSQRLRYVCACAAPKITLCMCGIIRVRAQIVLVHLLAVVLRIRLHPASTWSFTLIVLTAHIYLHPQILAHTLIHTLTHIHAHLLVHALVLASYFLMSEWVEYKQVLGMHEYVSMTLPLKIQFRRHFRHVKGHWELMIDPVCTAADIMHIHPFVHGGRYCRNATQDMQCHHFINISSLVHLMLLSHGVNSVRLMAV